MVLLTHIPMIWALYVLNFFRKSFQKSNLKFSLKIKPTVLTLIAFILTRTNTLINKAIYCDTNTIILTNRTCCNITSVCFNFKEKFAITLMEVCEKRTVQIIKVRILLMTISNLVSWQIFRSFGQSFVDTLGLEGRLSEAEIRTFFESQLR